MIRTVARAVLGGWCVAIGAGCKADLPALTDANQGLDVACTGPFADLLVDVFPTSLANPSAALGAPDGVAVSLMTDHVLTVGFVGLGGVTDAAGTDIRIHATVEPNAAAIVRVASTDMVFGYAADLTPEIDRVDISVADLTAAIYVRVIGVRGRVQVDAFEAVHDMCR